MPYGTIKVDNITFTNGGSDTTITVSGLAASTTGNLTVTGTISGAVVRATTVSGVTVTGTTVQGASGTFTSITGGIATITSGVFALGSAAAPSISFSSDPNTGIYSPGADQVAISTNGSGRLFVSAGGSVGVGGTPSVYKLDAIGNGIRTRESSDSSSLVIGTYDAGGYTYISSDKVGTGSYQPLAFFTGNSERLRITSAGLVGIGTSSPFVQLTNVSSNGGLVSSNSTGFAWQSTANDWAGAISSRPSSGNSYALRAHTEGTTASDYILFASSGSGTGTARFAITGAGNVGIGTTSPGYSLDVRPAGLGLARVGSQDNQAGLYISSGNAASPFINFLTSTNTLRATIYAGASSDDLIFGTGASGTERARIDSLGRLLVGTSTARANFFGLGASGAFQVEGTTLSTSTFSLTSNQNSVNAPWFVIAKSRGTSAGSNTVVNAGDAVGNISFQAADGTNFIEAARISTEVDGTPGANDMPGRLVFSTTADGASSPTERLRITSAGFVGIGNSSPPGLFHSNTTNGNVSYFGGPIGITNGNYTGIQIGYTELNGTYAKSMIVQEQKGDGNARGTIHILNNNVANASSATLADARLSITSAGFVGIGTSTPNARLHIIQDSTFSTESSAGIAISDGTSDVGLLMGTDATNNIAYIQSLDPGTSYATRNLCLNPNGSLVGIGTISPGSALDVVGDIRFTGSASTNGSNFIYSYAGGAAGAVRSGFFLDGANTFLSFYTAQAERARIDSSGRFLVGTSTARSFSSFAASGAQLQIEGTAYHSSSLSLVNNQNNTDSPYLLFGKSRGASNGSSTLVNTGDLIGAIWFSGADGTNLIRGATIEAFVDSTPGTNDMPGRLVFSTTDDGASSPTERMRIKNNGTIQLGNGTLGLTGTLVIDPVSVGMGYPMTINNPVSGSTNEVVIDIYRQGVRTGYITNTNTVTSYTSTSDYRLKENILPVTDGIARLKQLKPSRFNFIIEPEIIVDGFLAHEVQAVVPEAITGEKDEVDSNGNPVYQGIDQSKLVPLLTAALQEAVAKIESLEARLTAAGI